MSDKKVIAPLGDDFDLDTLQDLPSFKSFHTGGYIVSLPNGLERKKVGTHDAVEMLMECVSVEEITESLEADEKPTAPGDKCNTLFMLDNEMGQGKLKEVLNALSEQAGTKNFKELVKFSKGIKMIVIGSRSKENDDGKRYFNIVKCAVA